MTQTVQAAPAPKAAAAKATPLKTDAPPRSFDGYGFRFKHVFRALVKHRHTTNAEAIEYTEDLPKGDYLHSSRQTRVAVYKDKELLYQGEAVCWRPDNYIKALGRRNALIAATQHLPRKERQEVFEAFRKYCSYRHTPKNTQ